MIYYISLGVFWVFFFLFSRLYQCPSHRNHNLVPTPICSVCRWIQTSDGMATCSCRHSFFQLSPQPLMLSAWHAGGTIADQPKVTLMETEAAFCLSALPSRAADPPISAVASIFFSMPLEHCQQTPFARDTSLSSSEKQPASRAVHAFTAALSGRKILSF